MLDFIYDDTFEGFLTAVYEAYYSKEKPQIIMRNSFYEDNLFSNKKIILTDLDKFEKVYKAINNKISHEALENIYFTYLSDIKNCDMMAYDYIKLGFKLGNQIDMHVYDPTVLNVHKISKKVAGEVHAMLGFVRFSMIRNDMYYSEIEPNHNILQLITPHFVNRFNNENFIIHDLKREKASIYNKSEWCIIDFSKEQGEKVMNKNNNLFYEELWREYFNNMAIESRKNPKAQKRSMPVRYWKHLTEIK